jgi:hypothetical protein
MIGVSVSDIIKILDQVPIWKTLRELPKRVADLEEKVKALEAEKAAGPPKPTIPEARICPLCGGAMKVLRESADPTFGRIGMKVHHMRCEICGNEAERRWKAGSGYR